uniref:PI-PLC X domain-containing protein 1 isoform X3 n=1 Tax=Monopterus albus TaxID=43700 RepID=UPI0009B3A06C|nr:PI-PLC X domain-containing protein 1-like isoform X3 [Monopterus albus]
MRCVVPGTTFAQSRVSMRRPYRVLMCQFTPGYLGSHDAMSYCLDINSPLVRSESSSFRLLDRLFYCFTRPIIFRWATTQDKSIEEQLSMGIRYFDLRIAHKPNDSSSNLYFTHVIYSHVTVLVSVLTLRSLWASGYQVILSYDSQTAAAHQELWPNIPYLWANQRTAQGVISYLDWNKDMGRPEGFFISGLNLTADRCYITKNPKQSLRTLTFSNWECLKKWVEEQVPGSDHKSINIIAGDFVGPLPLCSLVIALNQKLVWKNSSQIKKLTASKWN